jgi:hypothetical protein
MKKPSIQSEAGDGDKILKRNQPQKMFSMTSEITQLSQGLKRS